MSRAEKISDKLHLFLHSNTNNQSYYDVDFDNSSRILTASLRIAHKRNIVLEVNTYYPYGMLNTSLSWHLTNNQFKYQSKEYLNTLNYNVLDFGARMGACPDRSVGNPAIARFTTPDPIMQFNNGYFAMGGNPVSMTDPSGMKATTGHYDDVQEHGLSETPERGGGGSPVTIDGMPLYGSTPMLEHIMGELMAKGPDGEDNILGYSSSTLSANIIQKDDKIFTSFNPVYQMVNTINNNYKSKYANYNIQGKDDRESGETDDYFTGYSWGPAIAPQGQGGIMSNQEYISINNGRRRFQISVFEPISNRWWPLSNNEGVQFNYPRNPKQTASYITAPNSFGGKTRFINDGIETLVGSYETDQILNNPFNWFGLTDRVYFRFQSIPDGNFYYARTLAQGTLFPF
nr:hypothetical protein [Bacteroidota bacterium]